MDIKVKQSLARLRRSLVSVDWRGNRLGPEMRAHGQSDSLDDLLAYHADALRAANVGWSPIAETWEDRAAPRWRPSPEMNAFVQRLSSTVDAEASVLVGLAARARDAARAVALTGAQASARMPAVAQGAASEEADVDAAFEAIRESLSAIAETALEAALSAVRTGSCARSLSRMEAGDGEIETALQSAREEIEAAIAAIEDRGAGLAMFVTDIREAARSADQARAVAISAAGPVTGPMAYAELTVAAEAATVVAGSVDDRASELATLVDALSARLIAILRESPAGDRRRARRIAFNGHCLLRSADGDNPARILDISLGGALVDPAAHASFRRGQPLVLVLPDMPAIASSIAGVSPQGVHLSFDLGHAANAQARPPLLRMLAALHQRDDAFVVHAIAVANAISADLSEALAENPDMSGAARIVSDDGEPAPLLRETVAPLLDALVGASPEIVYAVAMNRRAFVAHATISPAWREAATPVLLPEGNSSRTDATGRRHAQNRRACLALNVRIGGRSLRSVSAPVHIGGVHWGCVEVAFDPPDGPVRTETETICALFEKDQG